MDNSPEQKLLVSLRKILTARFDEGELRTLCFDLKYDYESLPGAGKADKARELVAYCERRRTIPELVSTALHFRPDVLSEFFPEESKSYPSLVICANDDANVDRLCKYIEANKISEAKMIQYSGDMVRRVIARLLEKGAVVELLLQHPSKALNLYQLDKMALFQKRTQHDFKNPANLVIRYYKEPAAVRAVKLDNALLSMGWYTYRNRGIEEDTQWLYGHKNATINACLDSTEAQDLVATFTEVFQTLWENAARHVDVEAEINQARKAFAK